MRRASSARRRQRMRQATLDEDGASDGRRGRPSNPYEPSDPWGRRRRGGNLKVKLATKLLSYGVFFLLFKLYRRRHPKEAEGPDSSDAIAGARRDKAKPLGVDQKGPLWRRLFTGGGSERSRPGEGGAEPPPPPEGTRTFRAGPDSVPVYVVPNFLPDDVVTRWRDALSYEWGRQQPDGTAYPPSGRGAWRHTARSRDPNGGRAEGGAGDDAAASRNATAHRARDRAVDSYARWELDPAHPLRREIEREFLGGEMLGRTGRILGRGGGSSGVTSKPDVGVSVAHYGAGDFYLGRLGDDGATVRSGGAVWHFALSLSAPPPQGDRGDGAKGGEPHLRFQCPSEYSGTENSGEEFAPAWCGSARLEFNSAIVTESGPGTGSPAHEIVPMRWDGWEGGHRNFVMAGSYYFGKDEPDEL